MLSEYKTKTIYTYQEIKGLHLELTNKCNALCPMCARSVHGSTENPNLDLAELRLQDLKSILPVDFVERLERVVFNGNFGDPCLAENFLEIIDWLIGVNPRLALTVQTNGGMRSPAWWAELGKRFRTENCGVYFGIDGLEDTNHLYRINVNWKRLMEHAQAFIAAGGRAGWNFIVFRHNEHQIEMARELATKMGFKHFLVKKTARFMLSLPEKNVMIPVLPVYKKDKSLSHLLEPPLNSEQKNTVLKLAEQNNLDHQIEISKELKLELKKNHHLQRNFSKQFAQTDFSQFDQTEVNCIVKRDKSLFIDCHGHVLPCCWTTWPLYSFWGDPEAYQMRQLVDEIGGMDSINAKNQTLQEIVEGPLFNKIAQGWGKASIKDGKPLICAKTCPRYLSPIPEEAARGDL